MREADIVILGAGIVGLVAANLLASYGLQIVVVDPNWPKLVKSQRAFSLNIAAKRILQQVGVWDKLVCQAGEFAKMHVWATNTSCDFAAADVNCEHLGYVLQSWVLQQSLQEACLRCPNVKMLTSCATKTTVSNNYVKTTLANEDIIESKLVIGADGGNSWLRNEGGFKYTQFQYPQSALVTIVKAQYAPKDTALQRFNQNGPVAFLPFKEANVGNIIWTTTMEKARHLQSMVVDEFAKELALAFDNYCGKMELQATRQVVPLFAIHSKQYVKHRLALIGDAAHVMHPLAGQGLNLGMLDAASLAEVLGKAYMARADLGDYLVLQRYARWRKAHNLAMAHFVDYINSLFVTKCSGLAALRDVGFKALDRIFSLKNRVTKYAMGVVGDLPVIVKEHLE